jgi:hypothetical protein
MQGLVHALVCSVLPDLPGVLKAWNLILRTLLSLLSLSAHHIDPTGADRIRE